MAALDQSDRGVMGARSSPPLLRWVGWITAVAAVAMIVTVLL